MTDLDAIAAEEEAKLNPPPQCFLCSIPEREWVDKAKGGRSMSVIRAVLIRQGHPADLLTDYRMKKHMSEHVR